jgi:hypothetical protein
MNWTSYKPVSHEGRTFGQKDIELERFIELPHLVEPAVLELAVSEGKTRRTPRQLLARHGWVVVHPDDVCPDMETYRHYLRTSKAEWSVAKHGYVVGRSGWFSCRSACYLAAGRPVVLQDTGFSDVIPIGEGIIAFDTLEEAADGIRAIEADYDRHSRAASEIADAYFDSSRVLEQFVEEAMSVRA